MKKKMIISMNSRAKLYHRAECRYAKQIKIKNRMEISRSQAEELGYFVCPHCDGMRALYSFEKKAIEKYVGKENLFVDMVGDWLYVRTEIGCWKIVYQKKTGKFLLFHKNYIEEGNKLENVEKGAYHRQGDKLFSENILGYLQYIREHDKARKIEMKDYRMLPRETAQQKKYYASARARERRRQTKRVFQLFDLIEQQPGYRELSFR